MTLDRRRGVEEEDLGLLLVAFQARGIREGLHISRRELASQTVGIPIKRVSSTNWLCEIGGEMPCRERPVRSLESMAA
jgi:hypothetical protein